LISLFRRHGVVIREKNFADTSERKSLLERFRERPKLLIF
jgi:hypothetical protein